MSLLSIVASSSAFRLPASPPPKGSSIDSDWSTKNKKQPGFLRLISAWYAMVFLYFSWHHENYDSHMPEVTGWSPVATIPRMQQRPSQHAHCLIAATGRTRRDPDHRVTDLRSAAGENCTLAAAKIAPWAVPIHRHGSFMANPCIPKRRTMPSISAGGSVAPRSSHQVRTAMKAPATN